MRVIEYLWNLIQEVMKRNNISSSGREYLVTMRRLRFKSYACHQSVNLIFLLF